MKMKNGTVTLGDGVDFGNFKCPSSATDINLYTLIQQNTSQT